MTETELIKELLAINDSDHPDATELTDRDNGIYECGHYQSGELADLLKRMREAVKADMQAKATDAAILANMRDKDVTKRIMDAFKAETG